MIDKANLAALGGGKFYELRRGGRPQSFLRPVLKTRSPHSACVTTSGSI